MVTGACLADAGFERADWDQTWLRRCGAEVITPKRVAQPLRHWVHASRQIIETVNGVLTDVLHVR